ncbi:MAG TPA: SGNH/GDSL hydrolase family protein [Sandaracinaceae bacterium LLY-WYZ-13_1]|nr:SGNH/GDSL hydrolase family protein [Sandaracinaceae bacterium LLY-WYZ-13_1]
MRFDGWVPVMTCLLGAACAGTPPPSVPHGARPVIEADTSGGDAAGAAPAVVRAEPTDVPPPPPEAPYGERRVEPHFDPSQPVALSPAVVARVREVAARVGRRRPEVFVKVGDSATVNRAFMRCLTDDDELDLGAHEALRPMIERIREARVEGGDSFSRDSEAASVGWSAHLVLRGSPTPLATEVRAANPRFALVMFGSNDVELGRLSRFGTRMTAVVDRLLGWGVVPVLSTIPQRNDDAEADRQVPRYNAVIRALARARRVPLVDLNRALRGLPERGLASDGVHPSAPVVEGRARGCDFTASGLRFGQNLRNLLNLQMLARLQEVLEEEAPADGPAAEPAPVTRRVEGSRWAVLDDSRGGERRVDAYPACDAPQDESGPERRYALHLEEPTTVRAEVLYAGDVDVDVHLVRDGACVARGDRRASAELPPGEHEVVVDTFGDDAGEFLLLVER